MRRAAAGIILIVVTFEDQPASFISLLPGNSRAGVTSQKQAATEAFAAAADAAGFDCGRSGSTRIRMTRFVSRIADRRRDEDEQAWLETWTAHYCGADYDVTLRFTPDEDRGTQIAVEPGRTARVYLDGWPQL